MITISSQTLAYISGGRKTLGPGGGSDPGNAAGRSVNNPFPTQSEEERKEGRDCLIAVLTVNPVRMFFKCAL